MSLSKRRYSDRDRERGYAISVKMVFLAYMTEIIIATASMIGAVVFARTYGHGDPWQIVMMMLAPVGYAVAELCRVPLALAVRTQASFIIKLAALLGVICAGGVTIKSMSQLGEIMFRPRLMDVVHVRERVDDARAVADTFDHNVAVADKMVAERIAEMQASDHQYTLAIEKLGGLPEQKCMAISGMGRDGNAYKGVKCSSDPRIAALTTSVTNAKTARDEAVKNLVQARAVRGAIDRSQSDKDMAALRLEYREAVVNSQLHSFTAMVFGKDPAEVSEGEIHGFLRIFVFIPAICAAFAATLVAMAAVIRIKSDDIVRIDDAASNYILDPLAEHIIREAAEAATLAARNAVPMRPVLVPNLERKV